MILHEMIVTNAEGKVKTAEGQDLTGQCIQGENVYSFYAIKRVNEPTVTPSSEKMAAKVRLMMPTGGELNGMYRFPRVGEKVVVGVEGVSHYLMGYLPTAEAPFSPSGDTVFDEEGQVLRYKKTGANVADESRDRKYSEIGFFKEASRWQTTDADLKTTDYSKEVTVGSTKEYYPYIDTVKISSTGDVTSNAQNLNEMKGRRIILESKYLIADETVDKNTVSGNIKKDLTERVVDESDVSKGDIVINADNQVVIDARNGILLKVGGSSVSIRQDGVSISAAKIDGVKEGAGPFDASLSVSQYGSISLGGKKLSGSFCDSVSLSDDFGGSISSSSGNVDIKGRAVSLGASTTAAQICSTLQGTMDILNQIISIPRSSKKYTFGDRKGSDITGTIGKAIDLTNKIVSEFNQSAGAKEPSTKSDHLKRVSIVSKIIGLIQSIMQGVRGVIEKKYYDDYTPHYDSSDKKFYTEDKRMDVTLGFEIEEAALQLTLQGLMLASAGDAMLHEATISLSQNANIVMDSKGYYQASIMEQKAKAALAGIGVEENAQLTQDEADKALEGAEKEKAKAADELKQAQDKVDAKQAEIDAQEAIINDPNASDAEKNQARKAKKDLESEKKDLVKERDKAQKNYNDASKNYDQAQKNKTDADARHQAQTNSEQNVDAKKQAVDTAKTDLDTAETDVGDKKGDLDQTNADYDDIKRQSDAANSAAAAAEREATQDPGNQAKQTAATQARQEAAQKERDRAAKEDECRRKKTEYDNAVAERDRKKNEYERKKHDYAEAIRADEELKKDAPEQKGALDMTDKAFKYINKYGKVVGGFVFLEIKTFDEKATDKDTAAELEAL